jgi:hypothetical protein
MCCAKPATVFSKRGTGPSHLEPGMQVITKRFPITALALRVREIIES